MFTNEKPSDLLFSNKKQAEEILEIFRAHGSVPSQENHIVQLINEYYELVEQHIQLVGNKGGEGGSVLGAGIAGLGMAFMPGLGTAAKMAVSVASTLVGSKISQACDEPTHVANLTVLLRIVTDAFNSDEKTDEAPVTKTIALIVKEVGILKKVVAENKQNAGLLKNIGITKTEKWAMIGAATGTAINETIPQVLSDAAAPTAKSAVSAVMACSAQQTVIGVGVSLLLPRVADTLTSAVLPVLATNEGIGFANEIKETPSSACMQGEALITTAEVSAKEVPSICSLRAETCIILVLYDFKIPSNAAIAHFDIEYGHHIEHVIRTMIEKLTHAGSSLENLKAEMFGGTPNIKSASTKSLTDSMLKFLKKDMCLAKENVKYQECSKSEQCYEIQSFDVSYDREKATIKFSSYSANENLPSSSQYKKHQGNFIVAYKEKETTVIQQSTYLRRMSLTYPTLCFLPSRSIAVSTLAAPPSLGEEQPGQPMQSQIRQRKPFISRP